MHACEVFSQPSVVRTTLSPPLLIASQAIYIVYIYIYIHIYILYTWWITTWHDNCDNILMASCSLASRFLTWFIILHHESHRDTQLKGSCALLYWYFRAILARNICTQKSACKSRRFDSDSSIFFTYPGIRDFKLVVCGWTFFLIAALEWYC